MLAGVNARIDDLQMVNTLAGKTATLPPINTDLHKIHLNCIVLFFVSAWSASYFSEIHWKVFVEEIS